MTLDGKRNRGRTNLRWRDLMKEDMARNQIMTEMAEYRKHCHIMNLAGTLRSVRRIGEKARRCKKNYEQTHSCVDCNFECTHRAILHQTEHITTDKTQTSPTCFHFRTVKGRSVMVNSRLLVQVTVGDESPMKEATRVSNDVDGMTSANEWFIQCLYLG